MIDRPMWCDDFDMDLPKVFPEARLIVSDLADVELWTTGHETNGVLNHPNVWNGDATMLAFFGFKDFGRDSTFYVGNGRPIRCTVWEAFRDAWPHHYGLHVERRLVWNTLELTPQFDTLMYERRGWRDVPVRDLAKARAGVIRSMARAMERLRHLSEIHAGSVRQFAQSEPA